MTVLCFELNNLDQEFERPNVRQVRFVPYVSGGSEYYFAWILLVCVFLASSWYLQQLLPVVWQDRLPEDILSKDNANAYMCMFCNNVQNNPQL